MKIKTIVLILLTILSLNLHAQKMEPVRFADKLPEYPDGETEMQKFITNNLIYPKEAKEKGIEEATYISVIIEEDGSFSEVKLSFLRLAFGKKDEFGFVDEAIRIVNMMPKWTPAQIDGKNVRIHWIIPVMFLLDSASSLNLQMQNKAEYSSVVRHYSIDLSKYYPSKDVSGYYFSLSLCDDGSYNMDLSGWWEVSLIYFTSDGSYEIKNDTLILIDSYSHHSLLFNIDSTLLTPIKAYPFMSEIEFKEYSKAGSIMKKVYEDVSIEKLVNDFVTKNIQENYFEEGIYAYDAATRFELNLKKDKKYQFCLKSETLNPLSYKLNFNLIFSTGTWERKGNLLLLWDTNLEHQFYGLIHEDGIQLLILRCQDDIFKRKH